MHRRAKGARQTRDARMDARQGDPWVKGGAVVLSDKDSARYHRLYSNFCANYAIMHGCSPRELPRNQDMAWIVAFVKFPPFKDAEGKFDHTQHCYVCKRYVRDQGGYTFVEHDKAVGANGLVSSRLTNCCMTCNSAWVAEFDRLSRVYKLNFKEKCAFARKYAAVAKRHFH